MFTLITIEQPLNFHKIVYIVCQVKNDAIYCGKNVFYWKD